MSQELIQIVEQSGLEKTQSEIILDGFTSYFEQAKEWEAKAKQIVVTDESQTDLMKQAREVRLVLKNIRVEAEKTRKEHKERSLREGKAIDGMGNIIKALIVPMEEYLERQEKFAERQAEKRALLVEQERQEKLSQYVEDVSLYQLKNMEEAVFEELLGNAKFAFESKVKAEKEEEEKRIAEEEARRAEQERIRQENELLKKEAEEREKQLALEREKQEKERKKLEEQARIEREEREKLEAEQREKERIESERLAKEAEQKKQAELAPDKEKLVAYARLIDQIDTPSVSSEEAVKKLNEAIKLINQAQLILKSL